MLPGVRSYLVFSGFGLKPPPSDFQSYSYSNREIEIEEEEIEIEIKDSKGERESYPVINSLYLHPYVFCVSSYLLYFVLSPFKDNGLLFWGLDLHIYHNPNFKRGYPQLLVRMKRRKKHAKVRGNIHDRNSNFLPETSGESAFSASTSLSVPFIRKPYTRQAVANRSALSPCDFPSPSSISVRQTKRIVIDQPAVLNQLSMLNWHSRSSYTQGNGLIENFTTTITSISQNHIVSPLQSSYFGLMVEPSKLPVRYSDMSAYDSPFPNLQQSGNSWPPVPMICDISASSLSKSTHQKSSLYENYPN
ncbi:hypothetical protein FD755_024366 [Muntiacus reevesi]|uniref:Uncharacterized protein n=1 Tax=Muntiacus reevesi TaxID=9886 RepID=A0A5N3V9S5_MUNRE|nr:hypothetical protein FD755_024366 [Muntiacus reevesi]